MQNHKKIILIKKTQTYIPVEYITPEPNFDFILESYIQDINWDYKRRVTSFKVLKNLLEFRNCVPKTKYSLNMLAYSIAVYVNNYCGIECIKPMDMNSNRYNLELQFEKYTESLKDKYDSKVNIYFKKKNNFVLQKVINSVLSAKFYSNAGFVSTNLKKYVNNIQLRICDHIKSNLKVKYETSVTFKYRCEHVFEKVLDSEFSGVPWSDVNENQNFMLPDYVIGDNTEFRSELNIIISKNVEQTLTAISDIVFNYLLSGNSWLGEDTDCFQEGIDKVESANFSYGNFNFTAKRARSSYMTYDVQTRFDKDKRTLQYGYNNNFRIQRNFIDIPVCSGKRVVGELIRLRVAFNVNGTAGFYVNLLDILIPTPESVTYDFKIKDTVKLIPTTY